MPQIPTSRSFGDSLEKRLSRRDARIDRRITATTPMSLSAPASTDPWLGGQPGGQTPILTVQHPGSGGGVEQPVGDWPDGNGQPLRSSLIAIPTADSGRPFGS